MGLALIPLANALMAQQRPLPDGVFAGVRWFRETDGALNYRRTDDPLSYPFNKGWGVLIIYSEEHTERFGVTLETGCWWFKNDTYGENTQGAGFTQRAITLPIMVGASTTVLKSGPMVLHVDLNAGLAYTQYIKRLDTGGIRVVPKSEFIYGPTVTFSLNLFKLSNGYRTGPRVGTSFFTIGGRTIHSPYGTLW